MELKLAKEVILTRFEDETTLFDSKTGKYFTFNKTGARIWELMQEGKDSNSVLSAVLDEFNVDEYEAKDDLDSFLDQLKQVELIVENE